MDFVALSGGSLAMIFYWHYLAERAAAAGPDETAAPAGRAARVVLTVLLAGLWIAAWHLRPDCSDPALDEPQSLTRHQRLQAPVIG